MYKGVDTLHDVEDLGEDGALLYFLEAPLSEIGRIFYVPELRYPVSPWMCATILEAVTRRTDNPQHYTVTVLELAAQMESIELVAKLAEQPRPERFDTVIGYHLVKAIAQPDPSFFHCLGPLWQSAFYEDLLFQRGGVVERVLKADAITAETLKRLRQLLRMCADPSFHRAEILQNTVPALLDLAREALVEGPHRKIGHLHLDIWDLLETALLAGAVTDLEFRAQLLLSPFRAASQSGQVRWNFADAGDRMRRLGLPLAAEFWEEYRTGKTEPYF